MKKNNDIAYAGVASAVVGVSAQFPALSGVASTLISGASSSCVGTAVSVGSIIASGLLPTVGAHVLIAGGITLYILFADN